MQCHRKLFITYSKPLPFPNFRALLISLLRTTYVVLGTIMISFMFVCSNVDGRPDLMMLLERHQGDPLFPVGRTRWEEPLVLQKTERSEAYIVNLEHNFHWRFDILLGAHQVVELHLWVGCLVLPGTEVPLQLLVVLPHQGYCRGEPHHPRVTKIKRFYFDFLGRCVKFMSLIRNIVGSFTLCT